MIFSDKKVITLADYEAYVGVEVTKRSGKPFKSGLKTATVRGVTTNPHTHKPAFVFAEDDSIVDAYQTNITIVL